MNTTKLYTKQYDTGQTVTNLIIFSQSFKKYFPLAYIYILNYLPYGNYSIFVNIK